MAVRFLLGVAEATITPAFVYVTAMWYTREEIPVRTGIWFAGNSFGGFATSLIAYGVGHIEKPLTSWQWLFIVRSSMHFSGSTSVSRVLINRIDIWSCHRSMGHRYAPHFA